MTKKELLNKIEELGKQINKKFEQQDRFDTALLNYLGLDYSEFKTVGRNWWGGDEIVIDYNILKIEKPELVCSNKNIKKVVKKLKKKLK